MFPLALYARIWLALIRYSTVPRDDVHVELHSLDHCRPDLVRPAPELRPISYLQVNEIAGWNKWE